MRFSHCLLRLQGYELLLKAIVATHEISAPIASIADAQADLTDGSGAGAIASEAVVAGVSSALDGLAQSLAPLADDAVVPESVAGAATAVTDTIAQAQGTLGC